MPRRGKILQGLGRECSQDYGPFFNKYRGNLQGFLDKIKTAWVERTEYDEKTGMLLVVGKPAPCACPLVKAGRTPAEFCNCSRGWTAGRLLHRAGQAGHRRDRGIGPARRHALQLPHRHQGVIR